MHGGTAVFHVCESMCAFDIRKTGQVTVHDFVKTKQRGVTLKEMNKVSGQTETLLTLLLELLQHMGSCLTNFQSHTQAASILAFTWLLKRPTLQAGCVRRAPAVQSLRRRSLSCTWPGSSSEDAASTTTAPQGSCDCTQTRKILALLLWLFLHYSLNSDVHF